MILRPRSLYAIALIMNSATGAMVVAIPLLAIRFGATAFELGLLGSLGALVYTLACLFAGRCSDRPVGASHGYTGSGRRRFILLSCGLLVLVDLCIFFVGSLRDIFILTVCGCFCAAFFWPPLQAWLAEIGGRSPLSKRLGRFNLFWSLGIMVGPIIGGYLYALDYRYPWCYGVAANSFVVVLLLAGRAGVGGFKEGEIVERPERRNRKARPFISLALWANFVCWFSLANVQSLYPKLAVERSFSPQLIGYLLFLVGVSQSIFFVILSINQFWHYRYLPLIVVHALAAAGMLMVFGCSSVVMLSVAFPLLGLSLALSYYSSIYYNLDGYEAKGRRTGIHEFIVGSGFFLGPIAGGTCAKFLGMRAPFLMCALLILATCAMELLLALRARARRLIRVKSEG